MEWIVKLLVLWFSSSVVILATGWYLTATIKPYFPKWWARHIVSDDTYW